MQIQKTVPIIHCIRCCSRYLGTFHLVSVEHRPQNWLNNEFQNLHRLLSSTTGLE